MKRTWKVENRADLTRFVMSAWGWKLEKPVEITVSHLDQRNAEQNRLLWSMLTAISKQVDWYGQKLQPEDWKHVFTAAQGKQRVVPGLDGGFVVLGVSTSRMTKAEFAELIELAQAFAADKGVVWQEP